MEKPLFIESREWRAEEIVPLIANANSLLPELDAADLAALRTSPQAQVILAQTEPLLADVTTIPQPRYTAYRRFLRDGDRGGIRDALLRPPREAFGAGLALLPGDRSRLALENAHPKLHLGDLRGNQLGIAGAREPAG